MYHLKTLFLFTKSDFKTVILPQSTFAIAGALSAANLLGRDPLTMTEVAGRMPLVLIWIWLNLLVENLSNQRPKGSIIEDAANKPWRPLPSGRITPEETRTLLMVSIPLAVGAGMALGAFKPSICLMTLIWMYNDLEGSSSDIWLRNLLNAGGLLCFSWGALSVMSKDHDLLNMAFSTSNDGLLAERAYTWMFVTGAVIMTTVHAQDMPDVEGDKARGRKTVPLLYGEWWARSSLAVMVMFWSVLCPSMWAGTATWWAWVPPLLVGCAISALTLLRRGQPVDEIAWKLWCLWAMTLYILPLFTDGSACETETPR
jgi:4-hydroxybenzoate polyprenyltransferase